MPVEVPKFDTLKQAQDWFIQTQFRGTLPPIDFSRIEHGIAGIRMTGTTGGAPTLAGLRDEIRRQILDQRKEPPTP